MKTIYFVGPWDLNRDLACLPSDPSDGVVLLVESRAKGRALPWHRKKLVLVLSAIHHFAQELRADGFEVDLRNAESYAAGIQAAVADHGATRIVALQPREAGLSAALAQLQLPEGVELDLRPDGGPGGHFLISREAFATWANAQKGEHLRADAFYRWIRRQNGWLLDPDGKPLGGKWSLDAENRRRVPPEATIPRLLAFPPDRLTQQMMERVAGWPELWGSVDGFDWPVTRADALACLDAFVDERLAEFGPYEDAMVAGEPFLWHSTLSVPLNLSLLHPLEIVEAALAAYQDGRIPLNSAEGLLRQVVCWREFMRGIYWLRPGLRDANLLEAQRPLPELYWTPSATEMRCLAESVSAVEAYGYAHHIQRLMVLGNFALLAGIRPLEVSHWFWAGFVDAYEWVELPNVHGMALYADDTFTTKPYAASGAYINRMSDYCADCRYSVKTKSGPDACPFNTLFWDFMERNRARLAGNHRLRMLYSGWDKRDAADREAVLGSAAEFLRNLTPAQHAWTFDDDAC